MPTGICEKQEKSLMFSLLNSLEMQQAPTQK